MASLSESEAGVYTVSGNLREEAAVKAQLEKSNFDLKMRVFYLEEKLTRLAGGETGAALLAGGHGGAAAADEAALNSLRLQIEEKNIELEQRNVLLTKAKTAIENLKKEVERNKSEHGRQLELEDRVRRLKLANDEMDSQYKGQLSQLEQQLSAVRHSSAQREQQRVESQNRADELQLALAHSEERCESIREDKDRIEEQWVRVNQKAEEMDEELTQLRAHCQLFRMQLDEHGTEQEAARAQLAEARHKFDEQALHHSAALSQLRERHIAEIEKERYLAVTAVQEAKDAAAVEAAREKAHSEQVLRESRAHDAKEVVHERAQYNARIDDLMKRLDDKQAEINALHDDERKLRSQHETDRTKHEHALVEAERFKVEVKVSNELASDLKNKLEAAQEELRLLRKGHEHGVEVKEGLRREQLERSALADKLEEATDKIESMRKYAHDAEIKSLHDHTEIRRLHDLCEDLKSRVANHEEVVRDNERWKAENSTLRNDLQAANHRSSEVSRELLDAQSADEHHKRSISHLELELRKLQAAHEALMGSKEDLTAALAAERSKHQTEAHHLHEERQKHEFKLAEQKSMYEHALAEHKAQMEHFVDSHKDHAEGFLSENRGLIEALRLEIDHLNKEKLEHEKGLAGLIRDKTLVEKELSDSNERQASLKDDVTKVFQSVVKSLRAWDETLESVLEGELSYALMAKVGGGGSGSFVSAGSAVSPNPRLGGISASAHGAATSLNSSLAVGGGSARDRLDAHAFVHIHDQFVARIDDLMQDVAVGTDRVQGKVDRCARVRKVFDAQAQRMLEAVQAVLDVNLDRATLLSHRHSEAKLKLDALRVTLDRDARQRSKDEEDMRAFRQEMTGSLVSDHAARCAALQATIDKNVQERALLEAKYEQASETASALTVEASGLRAELQELHDVSQALTQALAATEAAVADLSARTEQLSEANTQLSAQLEQQQHHGDRLQQALEQEHHQHKAAASELSTTRARLEATSEALRDSRHKSASLLAEVERLGKTQIHPGLAAAVLETQSMLQHLGGGAGGGGSVAGSPTAGGGGGGHMSLMSSNSSPVQAQAYAISARLGLGTPSAGSSARGQSALSALLLGGPDYRDAMQGDSAGSAGAAAGGAGAIPSSPAAASSASGLPPPASPATQPPYPGAAHRHVNFAAGLASPAGGALAFRPATPGAGYGASLAARARFASPLSGSGAGYLSRSAGGGGGVLATPGGTAATPTTLARTSMSRLSKLGTDLEALAKKLDSFEKRR